MATYVFLVATFFLFPFAPTLLAWLAWYGCRGSSRIVTPIRSALSRGNVFVTSMSCTISNRLRLLMSNLLLSQLGDRCCEFSFLLVTLVVSCICITTVLDVKVAVGRHVHPMWELMQCEYPLKMSRYHWCSTDISLNVGHREWETSLAMLKQRA